MVPVLRRVIAPESTTADVRGEIAGSDEADYLLWACAAWFLIVAGAAVASLPLVVLSSIWSGFAVLAWVLVACSCVALLPLIGYSILFAQRRRRNSD
jgi:hypothetical protein